MKEKKGGCRLKMREGEDEDFENENNLQTF